MTYVMRKGNGVVRGIIKKTVIGLAVFVIGLTIGFSFRGHREPRFVRETVYIHGRNPHVPRFPRGLHRVHMPVK